MHPLQGVGADDDLFRAFVEDNEVTEEQRLTVVESEAQANDVLCAEQVIVPRRLEDSFLGVGERSQRLQRLGEIPSNDREVCTAVEERHATPAGLCPYEKDFFLENAHCCLLSWNTGDFEPAHHKVRFAPTDARRQGRRPQVAAAAPATVVTERRLSRAPLSSREPLRSTCPVGRPLRGPECAGRRERTPIRPRHRGS